LIRICSAFIGLLDSDPIHKVDQDTGVKIGLQFTEKSFLKRSQYKLSQIIDWPSKTFSFRHIPLRKGSKYSITKIRLAARNPASKEKKGV